MKKSVFKAVIRLLPLIFAIIGALGGFAYYYFVGCASGTCMIASSPVLMPAYGTVLGLLTGFMLQPGKKEKDNGGRND